MAAAFEEFGVMPELIKAVEEMGWTLPTDIQAEAIPLILGGGDVMAAAETGAGKTGAFGLPVLQIVHEVLREAAMPHQTSSSSSSSSSSSASTDTVVGTKVALSPDDRDARVAVDARGLVCQSRDEFQWGGCRATVGVTIGKYYYEAKVTDEGLCRVGWSTRAAALDLGTDAHGYGFGGTGKKSNRRQFDTYGEPYGKNDVIGCFVDCDEGTIHFTKNGRSLDKAFDIPPRGFAFYPAVVLKNAEMEFNFGHSPFKYDPGDYKPISAAPIAETTLGAAGSAGRKGRGPLAIIIEPTRELAQQTHEQLDLFKKHLTAPSLEILLLVGGMPVPPALNALKKGVDIITATPGKLMDLIKSGKVDLSDVRFFVLDEADRLVSQAEDAAAISDLYSKLPKAVHRLQVLMFSATLHSPEITDMSQKICKFPTWVDLKGKESVPETVHHAIVWADPEQDHSWVSPLKRPKTDGIHAKDSHPTTKTVATNELHYSQAVKLLKPILVAKVIDAHKMDQALIFVRTRVDADCLEAYFNDLGGKEKGKKSLIEHAYSCASLHSGRSMRERSAALEGFKNGEIRFLICTDVAARGIDIKELPYVINVTLPDKSEDYIHRVGRVGRADRLGMAISIVARGKEKVWFHQCKSRGSGCQDVRLVEEGGCGLWFDEPTYIAAIQKRLGGEPIPELDSNMQLPGASEGEVVYGQKKDQSDSHDTLVHLQQLTPLVKQLAVLESAAQKQYWNLRCGFSS